MVPNNTGSGVITARGLSRNFGALRAVDSLDLDIRPGQVTGFLGPNGSGKTTTLMMMLGLLRPTSGHVTIDGQSMTDFAHPLRHVGAALEATGFAKQRTARQHLRCWAPLAGASNGRVQELLTEVGLLNAADRAVGKFSLGMRQRLSLATALLGDPQTLILDEPANGLDPAGVAWLRETLRRYADQGRVVLVSSHVLGEMERLADQIIVLSHGQLRYAGPMRDLIGQSAQGDLESAYLDLTTKDGEDRARADSI